MGALVGMGTGFGEPSAFDVQAPGKLVVNLGSGACFNSQDQNPDRAESGTE